MGRITALLGFWVGGYFLGSLAWMVRGPFLQFVQNLGLTSDAAGALIAGLIGSSVMVIAVLAWSFLSSSN
jgi:hypothetical protein